MDFTNTYSFAINNANVILKSVFYLIEKGEESKAAERYLDYCWWMEFAKDWIKNSTTC